MDPICHGWQLLWASIGVQGGTPSSQQSYRVNSVWGIWRRASAVQSIMVPLRCHWPHGPFQSEPLLYSGHPCSQPGQLPELATWLRTSQNRGSGPRQPCPAATLPLPMCDCDFCHSTSPPTSYLWEPASLLSSYYFSLFQPCRLPTSD